ncbi:mevalonate kinase family protein [Hyalangium rubrum]|uniref:Phosphomevalonate kinase n=1 Tax=Hyalangium rubrum TaxID=3103134 RepID=A0ABU5H956_9BACT|nr:phosphomevalonate kinase [Hyalangium sp. s54d21]MDY7229657.1 phosphomevalonate kinase [Hyalangium sp. s54d21]
MERAFSAPGKLFLSGEYAVLWGGVARVAAVAPRTTALVRQRADARVHVCLEEGALAGTTTPKGVRWEREVPPGFAFVARTLDEALRAHGRQSVGFELAVAPSAVGPGGLKLGMGGSACATVLAADATRFILEDRFDALKLALVAHTLGQGGKGSGGDVAASFAGGVLRYRRYDVSVLMAASSAGGFRAALMEAPPVDVWRLPAPKVALAYAFTGESASTKVLIAQVESRRDEAARQAFVARSDALGHDIEAGLGGGDFRAFSEAVTAQQALLQELGPTETEAMRRILAIASAYGCAGKQSGAGGGDGCILFAPSVEARAELMKGLEARGFHAMTLEVEPGLRGEGQADPRLRAWLDAHA